MAWWVLYWLSTAAATTPADWEAWRSTLTRQVDAQLPLLTPCVQFRGAHSEGQWNVALLFATFADGKVSAKAGGRTFQDHDVAQCLARTFSDLSLPAPPEPVSVGVVLKFDGSRLTGGTSAFWAAPLPPPGSPPRLSRDAVYALVWHKLEILPCARKRVASAADLSMHVEVLGQVDAAGRLQVSAVRGGESDDAARTCVAERVGRLRFPTGYEATSPVRFEAALVANVGDYATAREANWRLTSRVTIHLEGEATVPPAEDIGLWAWHTATELAAVRGEYAGCLHEGRSMDDVHALVRMGPAGVEAVWARGEGRSEAGLACIAATVRRAITVPTATRGVYAVRIGALGSGRMAWMGLEPAAATPDTWWSAAEREAGLTATATTPGLLGVAPAVWGLPPVAAPLTGPLGFWDWSTLGDELVLVVSAAPPAGSWDAATKELDGVLSGCGGERGAVFDVSVAEDGAVRSARAIYGAPEAYSRCASSRVANRTLQMAGMSRVILPVR